jgi:phosphopantothenoylcysteine decarboxylase
MHIELRKWADILVVAPLDANTLAKLAVGLCDNCLTCVWRAWDVTSIRRMIRDRSSPVSIRG